MKVETKPLVLQILQHAIPWRATALDSRRRRHEAKPRGPVSRPILPKTAKLEVFEETILPHLNTGYNLARRLLRNDQDAQDPLQEASLQAFQFFEGYRGGRRQGLAAGHCPEYMPELASAEPTRYVGCPLLRIDTQRKSRSSECGGSDGGR